VDFRSRGPYHRENGPGRNAQGNIVQHGFVYRRVSIRFCSIGIASHGWVGKGQVPKFDFAADFFRLAKDGVRIAYLLLRVENVIQPAIDAPPR